MIDKNKYLCNDCGFQWSNPEKTYEKCPDCGSKNIQRLNRDKLRGSSPDKCRCPECGYEEPKVKGVPCRTKICPECGSSLQGRGMCRI